MHEAFKKRSRDGEVWEQMWEQQALEKTKPGISGP
jgi:hypothetical protein